MITRRMILSAIALTALVGTVRAGPVTTFTNLDAFLEAAGDVHEIDFETLPDGSPSYSGAMITPEFNYTDQGVEFFSHAPDLYITGNAISGFDLYAGPEGSVGPRNWIIAEPVEPLAAVGAVFPGTATFWVFDTSGAAFRRVWGGGGEFFLGFIADEPITRITIDGGDESQSIGSFYLNPIPEPTTIILLTVVAGCVLVRRRATSRRRGV